MHLAYRAARIHDLFFSLTEGYDTAMGAKGLALSGVCSRVFPALFYLIVTVVGTKATDSDC